MSKETIIEEMVSECCGARNLTEGDDTGFCAECKDGANFITEAEYEKENE